MSLTWEDGAQVPSKEIDLVFLRDFQESFTIVKQALENNIGFFYVLAGVPLLSCASALAGHQIPFLDWGMDFATLFAASTVIILAYKKLKPDFNAADVPVGSEMRIVAAGVSFSIRATLLAILFVVPGIWFATQACLACVYACLENCKEGESIKRSSALVKGHFMTVFTYAVFKPFLVWLGMVAIYLGVGFLVKMLGPDLSKMGEAIINGLMMFIGTIFQLAIFPILVRLYFKLKNSGDSVVSPIVPAAEVPSALHKIDDIKLNPRW
jgi:hypothetical protein